MHTGQPAASLKKRAFFPDAIIHHECRTISRGSEMLRVPTRIAMSPIHGVGLFADAPIAAGTVIWEYDPHFDLSFTEEHLARLTEPARMQVDKYSYFDADVGAHVLCGDDARFMNHSSTPNTAEVCFRTVASKDISAGEEITCDYAELGVDPREYAAYGQEGARQVVSLP